MEDLATVTRLSAATEPASVCLKPIGGSHVSLVQWNASHRLWIAWKRPNLADCGPGWELAPDRPPHWRCRHEEVCRNCGALMRSTMDFDCPLRPGKLRELADKFKWDKKVIQPDGKPVTLAWYMCMSERECAEWLAGVVR